MSEEEFSFPEFAASLGFSVGFTVITYPLEFAEFLMQIGHTPIPGYPKMTMFGLRNTFKYVSHIKKTDGFFGCYRGLLSKIRARSAALSVSTLVSHQFYRLPQLQLGQNSTDTGAKFFQFGLSLLEEVTEKSVAIVVSQPMFVISWRVMGQFVGREELYSGFFKSVGEIYRREGLTGFFTGIIPRWLGEVLALSLSKTISFLLNNFVITDPLLKATGTTIIHYICYGLTYPFTVASVCYGVNDCGLACGQPPNMPVFKGWTAAWDHLRRSGRLYSKVASSVEQAS